MRIPKPHWKPSHKCWYLKYRGRFYRLHPDKETAYAMWAELIKRFADEAPADLSSPLTTVRELLTEFLAWTEKHRTAGTFHWYQKHLQCLAKHVPARLLVRELKPHHVTAWLDSAYPKCNDNTRRGAITAAKRAFNWAVDEGYLTTSPIRRCKRPAYTPRGDEAYITQERWEMIVTTVSSGLRRGNEVDAFLDYITVLWETGCRPQEIAKVESRHLDVENGLWKFPVAESKGRKRVRMVPLSDKALAICRRLALKHRSGALFRNSDGKPWTAFSVANRFSRLEKKGCGKLCAYMFRHTFATNEIIKGTDLVTLMNIMGHKDLTMLAGIYEHVRSAKVLSQARRRNDEPASATVPDTDAA